MSMICRPIPLASALACWFTEYPSFSTAFCTRSRVAGRTFEPLLITRETVTRATPAALATSSIVELRLVTRVGWQSIQQFATAEAACQQPEPTPNKEKCKRFHLEFDLGFLRRLLVIFLLCSPCGAAFARPALIPMPAAVAWHGGKVPITADTTVEGTGKAAATADYLARELGLKVGRGRSRIRLSLVPSGKIANPEGYHLRAAGGSISIEASDPRG